MIIGAISDGHLHFGSPSLFRNGIENLKVKFDAGDVLVIDKNSIADIWYKHAIKRNDVGKKQQRGVG